MTMAYHNQKLFTENEELKRQNEQLLSEVKAQKLFWQDQREEIEWLRKLVREAFEEGFQEGRNGGWIGGMGLDAWQDSYVCAALEEK